VRVLFLIPAFGLIKLGVSGIPETLNSTGDYIGNEIPIVALADPTPDHQSTIISRRNL